MLINIKLNELLGFLKITCENQEMPTDYDFYMAFTESFYTALEQAKKLGSFTDDELTITNDQNEFVVTNVQYKRIHGFHYDDDGISVLDSDNEPFEIYDLSLKEFAYTAIFSVMIGGYAESQSPEEAATRLKLKLKQINLTPMENEPFKNNSSKQEPEIIQAQKDLFDYCDGKSVENIEQTMLDYYKALRLLLLNLQSPAVEVNTLFGWENLCIIKQEDSFAVVGDFNSHFNIVSLRLDGSPTVGVFHTNQSMALPPQVEYNTVKVRALLWMLQYATEGTQAKNTEHYNSEEVKQAIDQLIEKHLNTDTVSIKPRLPSTPDKLHSEEVLKEYLEKSKTLQGLFGDLKGKLDMIEELHKRNLQD